jgi:hypothetical protein
MARLPAAGQMCPREVRVAAVGGRCECVGGCGSVHEFLDGVWEPRCSHLDTRARRLVLIAPGYGPQSAEGAAATGTWVLWCLTCVTFHDKALARARAVAAQAAQLNIFDALEPTTGTPNSQEAV